MADTLHSVSGLLTTSSADIIDAVPSSTTETVIGILLSNVSSSSADVTVDLSVTKSGGTLRHILNNVSLPFGTTIEIQTKITLETGDKLQGLCSASSSAEFNVSFLRQT
ncbi:MAG: hypothetical protein Tp156SUR915002_50 [Prokaryotic dsDNA virus sp.]|jgi:hypothetical protein|nr:MAG: hypothetical protein Tp162SUR384061_4 [Prokaryotic dsDNA virus sp.]QDP59789.1 MAG: hypothetical protein Tp156SUR915002_50 [Prokaryotic dsDNA virus sp.]|tara:strand:- start:479 stop:805 length:327 start_codon:yes stop_codon:yes gene_type:complete